MTKNTLADQFNAIEPYRQPGATAPSATRCFLREHFDTITAARTRGLTWPQITKVLISNGVCAVDGSELTWKRLKSLYHGEKYVRGGPRKRRPKPPRQGAAALLAATPQDDPAPGPTGRLAGPSFADLPPQEGYRAREAKRRERLKDFEPYPLPSKDADP